MYAMGAVELEDADGSSHNWRNDLATKLVGLQKDDGSWDNPWSQRWWEGKPELVTAWSCIALNLALREPR